MSSTDNLKSGTPTPESPKAFTETEIAGCMKQWNIKQLDVKNLRAGEPLLCILPDQVRHDNGHYQFMSAAERPCIARVLHPTQLGKDMAGDFLQLKGPGEVEFYKIDRTTGKPVYLFSGGSKAAYPVVLEFLYEDNPQLFVET